MATLSVLINLCVETVILVGQFTLDVSGFSLTS
jgi:hypothetical protein